MTLPNFLIIGAARSGTSALAEFLRQHPDVFLSEPKEPHFLSFENQTVAFQGRGDDIMINQRAFTSLDKYARLFDKATATAIGEGSVSTLYYYKRSIESIKNHVPNAKLVLLLRNPIDRAYSSYLYMRSRGHEEHADFRSALDAEESRIQGHWHHIWHYTKMGFYSHQIQEFWNAFGKDRLRIYLHEDLKETPKELFADLFGFLGVDSSFTPNTEIEVNRSGEPKSKLLNRMVREVVKRPMLRTLIRTIMPRQMRMKLQSGNLKRDAMPEPDRLRLRKQFESEIQHLGAMLNRDLTPWLEGKDVAAKLRVES